MARESTSRNEYRDSERALMDYDRRMACNECGCSTFYITFSIIAICTKCGKRKDLTVIAELYD